MPSWKFRIKMMADKWLKLLLFLNFYINMTTMIRSILPYDHFVDWKNMYKVNPIWLDTS